MESWHLMYGDFAGEYPDPGQRVVFMIATYIMTLIMLNLYISIVSEVFEGVQDNKEVSDIEEMLALILEAGRVIRYFSFKRWRVGKRYLHFCTTKLIKERKE